MRHFLTIICILLFTTPGYANSRATALDSLTLLHKVAPAGKKSDEIASADTSFATAESLLQKGEQEQAEQHYLLTIQKARVLLAVLAENSPATSSTPKEYQGQTQAPSPLRASPQQPASSAATKQIEQPTEQPSAQENNVIFEPDNFSSAKMVGHTSIYTTKKRDTLRLVAAKLGVSKQYLAKINNLDPGAALKPGQQLRYDNRKIIPQYMRNGIVINIPDRTLYYFKEGKLASSLPVALGVAKKTKKFDWTTPIGKFKVVAKQKDPTWYVPKSIQNEMEQRGKEVITSIPPGPRNPLGKYAIKTSLPGIMIHSTTKPGSIYSFASHGCIRVYPEQMESFFKEVKVNTPGEIIYRPVKLAVTEQGRVFLEVHHDVYGKSTNLQEMAKAMIEEQHIANRVDWNKVEGVLKRKAGLAEEVSF